MQPAVETDLRAARLSLEKVAGEEGVPAAVIEALAEIGRSLKRLERSCNAMLPYLAAENRSTAALLGKLAPLLPEELSNEVGSLNSPAPLPDLDLLDARKANELNGLLRGLLARAIRALPADEHGVRARAQIKDHLQSTLKLRPW